MMAGVSAGELSPLKRALLAIETLQQRVRDLEQARHESLAVIGIGCRIPGGVHSPEGFARLLNSGVDAIRPGPAEARPGWPNDAASLFPPAGYLDGDVAGFDAELFGISPREAASIDPQQRLALECTWEALEDAAIDPKGLSGSATGVFIGITGNDYAQIQLRAADVRPLLHAHFASGIAHSMASGRIAYLLGLQGPAISVDTACSSSLVAIHQACRSLRDGESDLAIAGGVNLLLSTDFTVAFQESRMLSADGRCRAFDARADGFSRGEGCGIVVLRRLSDALRAGDRILAVIRGSAVNQDGPSSGLTAPNGPAQEKVIAAALKDAGLEPDDIGYVEAHGTGTELGDPIEAIALGSVFGAGRPADRPLLIGSVKTNVGHLEAAAGVAGVLKAVLALQSGEIPASLHFQSPNPHIPWDRLGVRVASERTTFPATGGKRRAGVSSFGFSGTNAHIILEEAPTPVREEGLANGPIRVIPLSARTPAALHALAERYADALDASDAETTFGDFCHTAGAGRAHLGERLAVTGRSAAEASAKLRAFARGEGTQETGIRTGRVPVDPPRPVFLFTGQGSQRVGMGQGLYDTEPVFRGVLDRCDAILHDEFGLDLLDVMFGRRADAAQLLDRTGHAQPAIFALETALAELWKSRGARPAMVIGHSVGEYAAAVAAGAIPLEQGLRLIAERARLMEALPPGGGMLAVTASHAAVADLLRAEAGVSLAAVNAPASIVVSGDVEALDRIAAALGGRDIETRRLRVSHAFHSHRMDAVLEPLAHAASRIEVNEPRVPLISNRTGRPITAEQLRDRTYWAGHTREPVRFHDCLEYARTRGHSLFVECGPGPVLCGIGARAFPDDAIRWIPTLRKDRDDAEEFAIATATLYAAGVDPDWSHEGAHRRIRIPTYPFQRTSLWVDVEAGRAPQHTPTRRETTHPLLGQRIRSPEPGWTWEQTLQPATVPFLADHVVDGRVVVPAAAYLEMAIAGAADGPGWTGSAVRNLSILQPLVLVHGRPRAVQLRIDSLETDSARFRIHSISEDEAEFVLHAEGELLNEAGTTQGPFDPTAVLARCSREMDHATLYADLLRRGLQFGPAFQGVASAWCGPSEALGRIEPTGTQVTGTYHVHPALLDAGIQVMAAALSGAGENGASDPGLYLPAALDSFTVRMDAGDPCTSHARVEPTDASSALTLRATIRMYDGEGREKVAIDGLILKRLTNGLGQLAAQREDTLFEVAWTPAASQHLAVPAVTPRALADHINGGIPDLVRQFGADACDGLYADLEELSAGYIVEGFRQLGWSWQAGDRITAALVSSTLAIESRHARLAGRLLDVLAEVGVLQNTGHGEWAVIGSLPHVDTRARAEEVARRHGGLDAELTITRRCGERLSRVLTGAEDPLELLFPGGDTSALSRLYRDTPLALLLNNLIRAAVEKVAASWPDGRALRVLEIGGGTGGTTAHVLSALPAGRCEYTFTDIGPLFVARARDAFGERPGMRFATLDIDRDPAEQGFDHGAFDLVLASNVLHAAADVRAALRRVRSLMAPGGVLCALEVVRGERWMDLTVGLLPGWWAFTDTDLRPDHALLDRSNWKQVLREAGFEDPATAPSATGDSVVSRQAVILARSPIRVPLEDDARWLVLSDGTPASESVTRRLQESGSGARATAIAQPPHSPESVRAAIDAAHGITDLVFFASPDEHLERICSAALHLVQGLLSTPDALQPRLHFVTRGAAHTGEAGERSNPSHATLWGLARAARAERPELRIRCIDLPRDDDTGDSLHQELLNAGDEAEVALRHGRRLVPRLTPVPAPMQAHVPSPRRLVYGARGILDDLEFVPWPRSGPAAGEVEIEIEAAGLNFRDVVHALGVRSDANVLGTECVGVVRRVGPGVKHIDAGQRVIAAAGAFGDFVTIPADLAVPLPASISIPQAATLPIAFLTADYALSEIGRMQPGESVLVHAGAGGVGMAAIQLARAAGLTVFATAGTERKRHIVREPGVRAVFDSRSPSFADALLAETGGRGVDLVLNSLAGDFIPASIRTLAEGGRLLELGKSDVWTQGRVDAFEGARAGVTVHAIDLSPLLVNEPAKIRPRLEALVQRVERGELKPLPFRTFALSRAIDAFREMSAGRHIGKLVLVRGGQFPIRRDGSYLITGGLAGLGLLVAEHLAQRGAGRLLLVGRSGPTPEAEKVLDRIRAHGTELYSAQVDVADAAAFERVIAQFADHALPLRGVVHSAGSLDDAMLPDQSWERFRRVFDAKVSGSETLVRATASAPLDFLVLFSSIASVFGSPGQANHAAANAFVDALADDLAARGRPALAIGWGAWSEIGAAARHGTIGRTAGRGIRSIDPATGLAILDRLLGSRAGAVVASPMDWEVFRSAGRPDPFLERVAVESRATRPTSGGVGKAPAAGNTLADRLRTAPARRRRSVLRGGVTACVARVLGLTRGQNIEPRQPLGEIGLDSLLAVELRNTLGAEVGRTLPATLLFDHPSIDALVQFLGAELQLAAGPTPSEAEGPEVGATDTTSSEALSVLELIEGMTDEAVARWRHGAEAEHE